MGHQHVWKKLGLNLPWPLELWVNRDRHGNEHRHFRVRAVCYQQKKNRGRSTVMLTNEFSAAFPVKTKHGFVDFDYE